METKIKEQKFVCEIGKVVRETDKAVMVQFKLELAHNDVVSDVWFPKSKIQDGKVQPWLLSAKMRELSEKYRYVQSIKVIK